MSESEISMVFFSLEDLGMCFYAQVLDMVIFNTPLEILSWKKNPFHLSHKERGGSLDVNLEK